jgi:surface polysaccharide O-acyltransferase-like enzyme
MFWPDLVRCCALCLVVCVHVSGSILNNGYYAATPLHWWLAAVVGAVSRCGAPLFFMLSGALLLGKVSVEPAGSFLKKRIGKVLIPFLGWSTIYTAGKILFHAMPFSLSSFLSILSTPANYHLWFFYSIIGLYLIAPLFADAKMPVYRYVFWFWFISICCTFCIAGFVKIPLSNNFTGVLPTYLGYFVAGYLLRTVELTGKRITSAWIVFCISLCIASAGTGWLTLRNNGVLSGFFYDYLNVHIVAMTLSVFLLLKTWGQRIHPVRLAGPVRMISAYSLGIYAFHPMLLDWLSSGSIGIRLNASFIHPVVGMPLTFAVTMLVSMSVVFVLSKIPLLKKMV